MGSPLRKAKARLAARQKDYEREHKVSGFTRPGSMNRHKSHSVKQGRMKRR